MKVKAFMRVAKKKAGAKGKPYVLDASTKVHRQPLSTYTGELLPTALFAVELEIPDNFFHMAEQVVAEITVPDEELEIAAEVEYPDA